MAVNENKNNAKFDTTSNSSLYQTDDEIWDDQSEEDLLACCHEVEVLERSKIQQCNESVNFQDNDNQDTPLRRFRPGYLWVSDLTKQNWCEQQLYYSITVQAAVKTEDTPVMKEGSSLHLARELAVHEPVQIKVTSNEDIWAVKVLNLLDTVQGFLNGRTLAREVPIFGAPFGKDVFFVGLIDELRFDVENYTITLLELKTKSYKSPPSKAQKSQHKLQVMMYKKLFDDLVKGNLRKNIVAEHLRLDLQREFGDDVIKGVGNHFLDMKNLDKLLDHLFLKFQGLTCINELQIEYVHQESRETLFHNSVDYDDTELLQILNHYLKFWSGERDIIGVDIEEAWKCGKCDFAEICEWRKRKSEEYSTQNIVKPP